MNTTDTNTIAAPMTTTTAALRARLGDALVRAYLEARKGHHPLAPHTSQTALCRARSDLRVAKNTLGLDFKGTSRARRTAIDESAIPLDDARVEALGFEPERLTARVVLSVDDFCESLESSAENAGFSLVEKRRRGCFHFDENENRPDHSSVEIDIGGYRRSEQHFLTLNEKDATYFYGVALKGASRGVEQQTMLEVRRAAAKNFGRYLEKLASGEYGPYVVSVEVLWDGEVVGSDHLGGVEISGYGSKAEAEIADVIDGHGMLDTALDEAVKWADAAHDKLPPRAKKCAPMD
jgi:hypothetical protein